jgi:hypothetical protein
MWNPPTPLLVTPVFATLLLTAGPGATQSRVWERTDETGTAQHITTRVVQHEAGNVVVTARFSNGRRIDGDNMIAEALLMGGDEVLASVFLAEAMNAAFLGSTNVRYKEARLVLEPGSITEVRVSHYHWDSQREPTISFSCKDGGAEPADDSGAGAAGTEDDDAPRRSQASCTFSMFLKDRIPTVQAPFRAAARQADTDPCTGYPILQQRGADYGVILSCDRATGRTYEDG